MTRRCNLSCGYCSEYDQVSEMVPFPALKERIDALHRLGVVNIALLGGEPLMHPELPEIVAYADRRAQVSVTTNGFDVAVNMVLCDRTKDDFLDTLGRLNELGFPVSIDLLHGPTGTIEIGGQEYAGLWARYYASAAPFSFLERDYGARLLLGERPRWKCRAGSRFIYVDEWGKAQLCSAQRGRLGKPITEYTRQDARDHHRTYKGCEAGCSMLCHYRDSALDNRPLYTIAAMIRQVARRAPFRRAVPDRESTSVASDHP